MKNVKKLSVSSVIENLSEDGLVYGDIEKTEITVDGEYEYTSEKVLMRYSEKSENGVVNSEIVVTKDAVTVTRSGAVSSRFEFSEGQRNESIYTACGYSFDTEIYTRKIRSTLTECGGKLDIHYDMKIGGADKRVRMRIVV